MANPGAKVIKYDAAGTTDIQPTAWTPIQFATEVLEDDPAVVENLTTSVIRLNANGKYLVLYNIVARNDTYVAEVEFLSRLQINLAGINEGRGQGYRRDANDDRVFINGAAIIDITGAPDNLTVATSRSSVNDPINMVCEATRSGMFAMKLPDDADYFRGFNDPATAQLLSNTAYTNINWDTSSGEKDGSYTHTDDQAGITLAAGHYLVLYTVRVNTGSTTTRCTLSTHATLGGSIVPQSWGYSFIRGNLGCNDGAAQCMFVVNPTSAQELLIKAGAELDEANPTKTVVKMETAIQIVKIPDVVDFLRVSQASDQDCSASTAIIATDTEQEEDTGSFSHNVADGRTTIQAAGDYLFMFGARAERTGTSGTPLYFGYQWAKNATRQAYLSGGSFMRGAQSTADTYGAGGMAATPFPALAVNDIIDIRLSDEGSDGSTDNLKANEHGYCAINLTNWIAEVSSSSSSKSSSPSSISLTSKSSDSSESCLAGFAIEEGFENPAGFDESGWTITTLGTGQIKENYPVSWLSPTPPHWWGERCCRAYCVDAFNWGLVRRLSDPRRLRIYVRFEIILEASLSVGAGTPLLRIFRMNDIFGSQLIAIEYYEIGGNNRLRIICNRVDNPPTINYSLVNLTVGVPHLVEVRYDQYLEEWEWRIDEVPDYNNEGSGGTPGTLAHNPRDPIGDVQFGALYTTDTIPHYVAIDNIAIDECEWPGSESSQDSPSSSSDASPSSISSFSSESSSSVSSLSSDSSSAEKGDIAWGHDTGVTELNVKDFQGKWTGTGEVGGTGDAEVLKIESGESMESDTWRVGPGPTLITYDQYLTGSGTGLTLEYKTGATRAACEAASYTAYVGEFTSLNWVKIRISKT